MNTILGRVFWCGVVKKTWLLTNAKGNVHRVFIPALLMPTDSTRYSLVDIGNLYNLAFYSNWIMYAKCQALTFNVSGMPLLPGKQVPRTLHCLVHLLWSWWKSLDGKQRQSRSENTRAHGLSVFGMWQLISFFHLLTPSERWKTIKTSSEIPEFPWEIKCYINTNEIHKQSLAFLLIDDYVYM